MINHKIPNSNYRKKELFAEAQPYEFLEKVKLYLAENAVSVDGIHLLDDGISAGLLRVDEEPITGRDGLKMNISLEITARNGSLDSIVKKIQKEFGSFVVKDSK